MSFLHVISPFVDGCMVTSLVSTLDAIAPGVNHSVATVGQAPPAPAEQLPTSLKGSCSITLIEPPQRASAESSCDISSSIEGFIQRIQPSRVILYGHCETAMVIALVCSKLRISVAHVGAGERPLDKQLPEYTNSMLVDQLADVLVAFSAEALDNLRKEGVSEERIYSTAMSLSNELQQYPPQYVIRATEGIARALAVPKNFNREKPLCGDLAPTAKARSEVIQ